ncbi:MAG TPA: NAD(P)-binding domain-containing protein [Bdellovibrionota bacterium]|nr:NAD(P)-binding domain-containing protein [Bdellovibrionota bacterium]
MAVLTPMISIFRSYARWLHTQWPAGGVERRPDVRRDGSTRVPGLYVVGDVAGRPLLKIAADQGALAVRTILTDRSFSRGHARESPELFDVIIIGAGVAGVSAALEAKKATLRYLLLEASEPFSTLANMQNGKPIYLYPENLRPLSSLTFTERAETKELLLDELRERVTQEAIVITPASARRVVRKDKLLFVETREGAVHIARQVIVAIGRTGNFVKLKVPGENLPKVFNRLYEPASFAGRDVLVVGGGDSAVEAAIALANAGARVTLSYRGADLWRPKPANLARLCETEGTNLVVRTSTQVREITPDSVALTNTGNETDVLPNDAVFSMIGRESPLDFFRRSGVPIRGERTVAFWATLAGFLLLAVLLFHWKTPNDVFPLYRMFETRGWFPFNLEGILGRHAPDNPQSLRFTLGGSASRPNFYYTFAYTLVILIFGLRRMRRTRTPYVRAQTWTLIAVQALALFILPEILLPWAGHNGWFTHGTFGGRVADLFFEANDAAGYDRAYWRAYGFILAWPLFIWNVFTEKPMWGWLSVSFLQTFVLIPWMIRFWGKGSYCGWICSCGALAETLGDAHRSKMPHGPFWNRLNFLGQLILAAAMILFVLRVGGWIWPGSAFERLHWLFLLKIPFFHYSWFVDLLLSGILGVGLYFWFSGRMWCRFACPLAALMNIYARFSRFRIFAKKEKCISCGDCTAICHQGIDVMSFASQGLPMRDPQCVACNACVDVCPTHVLSFGRTEAGVPVDAPSKGPV